MSDDEIIRELKALNHSVEMNSKFLLKLLEEVQALRKELPKAEKEPWRA